MQIFKNNEVKFVSAVWCSHSDFSFWIYLWFFIRAGSGSIIQLLATLPASYSPASTGNFCCDWGGMWDPQEALFSLLGELGLFPCSCITHLGLSQLISNNVQFLMNCPFQGRDQSVQEGRLFLFGVDGSFVCDLRLGEALIPLYCFAGLSEKGSQEPGILSP